MGTREKMIDANELLNSIRDDYNINGTHFAMIRRHIEEATAVDAVEVVRCRDCKHKTEYFNSGKFVCKMKQCVVCGCVVGYIKDDDFCSYGERKEGTD